MRRKCRLHGCMLTASFQALSQNCEMRLFVSSCQPVSPSVFTKQIGSYLTDFHEIWHLTIFQNWIENIRGPGSSVGIATDYGLDGRGSNPGGGEIFSQSPDRPWGPPSLLYNGYRAFPGGRGPGRGADYPPRLGPGWPVIGWPLPLYREHSGYINP
jgi:hypothetical protein